MACTLRADDGAAVAPLGKDQAAGAGAESCWRGPRDGVNCRRSSGHQFPVKAGHRPRWRSCCITVASVNPRPGHPGGWRLEHLGTHHRPEGLWVDAGGQGEYDLGRKVIAGLAARRSPRQQSGLANGDLYGGGVALLAGCVPGKAPLAGCCGWTGCPRGGVRRDRSAGACIQTASCGRVALRVESACDLTHGTRRTAARRGRSAQWRPAGSVDVRFAGDEGLGSPGSITMARVTVGRPIPLPRGRDRHPPTSLKVSAVSCSRASSHMPRPPPRRAIITAPGGWARWLFTVEIRPVRPVPFAALPLAVGTYMDAALWRLHLEEALACTRTGPGSVRPEAGGNRQRGVDQVLAFGVEPAGAWKQAAGAGGSRPATTSMRGRATIAHCAGWGWRPAVPAIQHNSVTTGRTMNQPISTMKSRMPGREEHVVHRHCNPDEHPESVQPGEQGAKADQGPSTRAAGSGSGQALSRPASCRRSRSARGLAEAFVEVGHVDQVSGMK